MYSRLRIVERAGKLYELLAPFSGHLVAAPGTVFGTVGTEDITREITECRGALAASCG